MKLRVISGKLASRGFDSPGGHKTHPMSEKIRGALFNALGDVTGLTLLDAYAGTGAISIEALSRGAKTALAIDKDKRACEIIRSNKELLGFGDELQVICRNVGGWSKANRDKKFSLVICDPPYDKVNYDQIEGLARHVKNGGLLVFSLPSEHRIILDKSFELISKKAYGDAALVFYRKTE
jgi:16S rRNA (guanine966-N2)-methyltransferase